MTSEQSGRRWCVVTGGRGFAARHLVEKLILSEMFSVRIADLGPTIQLESHEEDGVLAQALRSGVAQYVSMDLCNMTQLLKGLEGAEVVFHMAAPNSSINSYKLHHSVNVQGTQNVIDACVELKVKRLIYTSSPSVVSDGVHGIFNGTESLPYPAKHNDSYSATKAEGEALVIKANGKNGLLTCCLRPSSIFGPGDRLLVPSLVSAARAGKSKFIIGNGNNLYDFTYVENVAHAHICAERALASQGIVAEKAAGEAYFITNSDPIKFWEFVSLILEGLGYQRPRIRIPAAVLMPIAYIVELVYKIFGPYGMAVPQLTPSRIRLISQSRTFNSSKANDRLGYTPIVPLQEGIRRTIDSYQHLRAGLQSTKDGPSKASRLHGDGRVGDALLWRDRKQTLVMMLFLVAFHFHFVSSGYTIVTAVAKLLLLATVLLFINGNLPQKLFGYRIEKIHESKFHVSEEMSRQVAGSITFLWNSAMNALTSLTKGKDWMLFFKVVFFLSVISFLGTISLHTSFVIALPTALVVCIIYKRKHDAIDSLLLGVGEKLKLTVLGKSSDVDKKH